MPTLLKRVRAELSAEFNPAKPIRVSRAPGRLDVMGGIADYTGSLVSEATLDRAAAIALQEREDRQVQIFSFNLFDEHQPFTFRIPLDSLATFPLAKLHQEFTERGRRWAGYLAGCLYMLHEAKLLDLADPKHKGMNLALCSTVPLGAGVSSSAAIEVATMMNLVEHLGLRDKTDPMHMSAMCQAVENRVVGAPCGIMDQVSSCYGEAGSLLQMICQPHEIRPALHLPAGTRVLGINSNVKHSVGGGMYGKTRCAAFMGHRIILSKLKEIGEAAGRSLLRDPLNGYLANLDPDDYKKLFRPSLPEHIGGQEFLDKFGSTIDTATQVGPAENYHVLQATDHHVLEARRVKQFVAFLQRAAERSARKEKCCSIRPAISCMPRTSPTPTTLCSAQTNAICSSSSSAIANPPASMAPKSPVAAAAAPSRSSLKTLRRSMPLSPRSCTYTNGKPPVNPKRCWEQAPGPGMWEQQ